MQRDSIMYSNMAPAPLFARDNHQSSRHTNSYATRYLDPSSTPDLGSELQDQYGMKRHSHQQYNPYPRQYHARSSSLQHKSRPKFGPDLGKPLPPPPPPQARAEAQCQGQYVPAPNSSQLGGANRPAIPSTIPEAFPAPRSISNSPPSMSEPFPAPRRISQSPPTLQSAAFTSPRQMSQITPPGSKTSSPSQRHVPTALFLSPKNPSPAPEQANLIPDPMLEPFLSPRAINSPSALPTYTIHRSISRSSQRRRCTYKPSNPSAHPTYTVEQLDTHLLSIRRNGTPIADIKTGYTGHHAKLTFVHPSVPRTEVERKGHSTLGQDVHYPVELAALGQTCDWKKEESGGFVLRDECMGTAVARVEGGAAGADGKVEVLIDASEGALDEVMVGWMAVGEIEREEREDDGLIAAGREKGRSVVGKIGNVMEFI